MAGDERETLTVFDTSLDESKLRNLVMSLRSEPGYGSGIRVREDKDIRGLYCIEEHRGTIIDNKGAVRVVKGTIGGQIWAKSFDYLVGGSLRKLREDYTSGQVELSRRKSLAKEVVPIPVEKLKKRMVVSFVED